MIIDTTGFILRSGEATYTKVSPAPVADSLENCGNVAARATSCADRHSKEWETSERPGNIIEPIDDSHAATRSSLHWNVLPKPG